MENKPGATPWHQWVYLYWLCSEGHWNRQNRIVTIYMENLSGLQFNSILYTAVGACGWNTGHVIMWNLYHSWNTDLWQYMYEVWTKMSPVICRIRMQGMKNTYAMDLYSSFLVFLFLIDWIHIPASTGFVLPNNEYQWTQRMNTRNINPVTLICVWQGPYLSVYDEVATYLYNVIGCI